jgi:hypothetical protein
MTSKAVVLDLAAGPPMDSEFRPLSAPERELLEKLLEILKYDPAPIINPPTARNLVVLRES